MLALRGAYLDIVAELDVHKIRLCLLDLGDPVQHLGTAIRRKHAGTLGPASERDIESACIQFGGEF